MMPKEEGLVLNCAPRPRHSRRRRRRRRRCRCKCHMAILVV